MLLAVIAACEIGFWVLLAAGLATRYLLRLPKAGLVLLAAVPLVDVVMLVAGVIDIHRGGEPSFKHSLAAIFIGVSVGFGHQTLKWADKWAAHFMGGAPRPVKPPKRGPERARRERAGWYHHLLAYVVGVGIMIGLGLLSGQGYDAALAPAWTWTIVLVIDAIVSFSYSFERTEADQQQREKQSA
ncbi:2TM domain-containing protein [Kribbella capetownensis]|uniref:2TM domain-containing protein n=1 Tax=Kribbella capetownensis TaxID=1572659 RepID=A0A4R0K6G4_9ACTN|nr:2TM domain-containing protein [Kribbella capetownensis]TCC53586.1 2TM domain-containing protein [Kribbella capetownensis]